MEKDNWNSKQEKKFKQHINQFFSGRIKILLDRTKEHPLKAGDELADFLKASDEDVVKIITPRAVKKWASPQTVSKWENILKDPQMLLELRTIGRSIANTMRPLAGNNFALWIARILNAYFEKENIPLKAATSGKIIKNLGSNYVIKDVAGGESHDYKPDIDIVLVRKDLYDHPVAIISAKTTLAERIMQTINWHRFIKNTPNQEIKLFLVTAWETFESGANRERVQELDRVYVCNRLVNEYGNIKLFSKIVNDLKALCN